MKNNIFLNLAFCLSASVSTLSQAAAHASFQTGNGITEKLNRHVVAVPQSAAGSRYLVSWRMLATDDDYTTFDVLRNGVVVKTDINSSTNYLDTKGSKTAQYRIVTKQHGQAVDTTQAVTPWQGVFAELMLDRPEGDSFHDVAYTYSPNDCSVADADGDGNYELVVKWEPSAEADNSQGGFTGPTIFDCYRIVEPSAEEKAASGKSLDCTLLWRINMGHNIRSGAHYVPFLFYDFDGDGRAEFIVKTGPGTRDGAGRYVSNAADDDAIRAVDNEREYLNAGGQVMYGPEFLTVFDGLDGHAIHTVYYNPNRGCFVGGAPECRSDIWGDDYGNRSERYLAAVAHLDSRESGKASAVMCRGYYTRSYLWAVDFDGRRLSTRWRHGSISRKTVMKTDDHGVKDVRRYDSATYDGAEAFTAYGQGNHNLTVGDVDGDGLDEIVYGSAAIDHDGTLLWSTGLSHGDAIHMADLLPDRPGLEVFQIHEDPPYGMHICDAATGELLIHHTGDGDCARGMAADVMNRRGYEFWNFGDANMYNAADEQVVGNSMSFNFRVYWDGDVYDELIGDIGNHNQPFLEKFGTGRLTIDGKQLYQHGYNVSCNGTKGSPCLVADIFGDWREEMIFFNNEDKRTLNVFSSAVQSAARVPCLMQDHNYRLAVAWQNAGYNQPPHLSYYLPDATRPRFDFEDEAALARQATAGDSIIPIVFHYVNCTGATLSKVQRPDGTSVSSAQSGLTLRKDAVGCRLAIEGVLAEAGTWQLTLRPQGSSNGEYPVQAITIEVVHPTDIDSPSLPQCGERPSAVSDLQGRRLTHPLRPGIYIQGGRKILVR